MSDVYPGGESESQDKSVDDLYAALLDDIGVNRVPSAPGDAPVAPVAPVAPMEQIPPPMPLSPAPPQDDEATPLVPGVARSSYVAPAPDKQVLLPASSAAQPDDGLSAAPTEPPSLGGGPTIPQDPTPSVTDSSGRPRPSFDDLLYGRVTQRANRS